MNRRIVVPLAAVALPFALGACSTFTDSDAAARVGDEVLTTDELDDLLVAATPDATGDEPIQVSGDTARNVTQTWVITRVLEQDAAAAGAEVTDDDRDAARAQLESGTGWSATPALLQDLIVDQTAAFNVWQGVAPTPTEDELRASYELGIEASGIACTAHILVETESEAADVVAALDGGADFATLAEERSTDPGSAAEGGVLPCDTSQNFQQTYVPEYVEAALATPVGEWTDPVRSDFGYHVILVRPFDDVADEGIAELWADPNNRFNRALDTIDLYLDPRIGTFDRVSGVIPIGLDPAQPSS